jgi:glycosyltransferase involved in cell wall biosynthesis
MKLSVIIPAFNEAKRIGSCLEQLREALAAALDTDDTSEVLVVDNNSTDATAELARKAGVRVIFEPVNQIARARNAGANQATGDWLLFLDADTLVSAETMAEMRAACHRFDCAGGSTIVRFDHTPWIVKPAVVAGNLLIRWTHLTCGCFLFCRTELFRQVGGFNLELFAAEDAEFGRRMKKWASERGLRLVMIRSHPPVTSLRKLYLYGWTGALKLVGRFILSPRRTIRDKKYLGLFYDGRR